MWRVAYALTTLRDQVNAQFPNRSKASDGTIGDLRHQHEKTSDHNPWIHDPGGYEIVSGMDITNDPSNGLSSRALADAILRSKDARVKYVISNGEIASGSGQDHQAGLWRPYHGVNPHEHHVHISVKSDKSHYDDRTPWKLDIQPPVAGEVTHPAVLKPFLKLGSIGPGVKELQKLLHLPEDGQFTASLEKVVRNFQSKNHLVVDGRVGPSTWSILMKGEQK